MTCIAYAMWVKDQRDKPNNHWIEDSEFYHEMTKD